MSLSPGLIAAVALIYMAILFAIAFYGDRRSTPMPPKIRAWVYSLSLAVYCTSWTFFGAVGQAAEQLWSFLPIYLGPTILLLTMPWVLQKMVMISKQENITSIADFSTAPQAVMSKRYYRSVLVLSAPCAACIVYLESNEDSYRDGARGPTGSFVTSSGRLPCHTCNTRYT